MSAATRSISDRIGQVWAAARLDQVRLERGRYRRVRLALIGLPVLGSALIAAVMIQSAEQPFSEILVIGASSRGPDITLTRAVQAMWAFSLRFCMFLAAIDVFGNLYRGELAERTLHHLFLQPLRRETITVGKYLAGLLSLVKLGSIAWLLVLFAWLIPHGPGVAVATLFSAAGLKMLASYLAALVLAMAAYGGLFLLAGMISRGAVMLGAGLWIWELLAQFLPLSFQRFTVAYWLSSLRPVRMPPNFALAQEVEPAPVLLSALVCLMIGAAATAGAAWWSRHLQLAYGAKD